MSQANASFSEKLLITSSGIVIKHHHHIICTAMHLLILFQKPTGKPTNNPRISHHHGRQEGDTSAHGAEVVHDGVEVKQRPAVRVHQRTGEVRREVKVMEREFHGLFQLDPARSAPANEDKPAKKGKRC